MEAVTRRLLREQIVDVVVLESGKKEDAMWYVIHRHQLLSWDAVMKGCALSPWASCAVLMSKKHCNRVCENHQRKFQGHNSMVNYSRVQ